MTPIVVDGSSSSIRIETSSSSSSPPPGHHRLHDQLQQQSQCAFVSSSSSSSSPYLPPPSPASSFLCVVIIRAADAGVDAALLLHLRGFQTRQSMRADTRWRPCCRHRRWSRRRRLMHHSPVGRAGRPLPTAGAHRPRADQSGFTIRPTECGRSEQR